MSLSFPANFGSLDSLNVRMHAEPVGEPQGCAAPIASSRQPPSPAFGRSNGLLLPGRGQRQIDHPLHGGHRERWLAGFARLIARQAYNALRHEPRLARRLRTPAPPLIEFRADGLPPLSNCLRVDHAGPHTAATPSRESYRPELNHHRAPERNPIHLLRRMSLAWRSC